MMTHVLKTDPASFKATRAGKKRFEIRLDDRGYGEGDTLLLRETVHSGEEMKQGKPLEYTGEGVSVVVTHILRGPIHGLADGWVIMSVAR